MRKSCLVAESDGFAFGRRNSPTASGLPISLAVLLSERRRHDACAGNRSVMRSFHVRDAYGDDCYGGTLAIRPSV